MIGISECSSYLCSDLLFISFWLAVNKHIKFTIKWRLTKLLSAWITFLRYMANYVHESENNCYNS